MWEGPLRPDWSPHKGASHLRLAIARGAADPPSPSGDGTPSCRSLVDRALRHAIVVGTGSNAGDLGIRVGSSSLGCVKSAPPFHPPPRPGLVVLKRNLAVPGVSLRFTPGFTPASLRDYERRRREGIKAGGSPADSGLSATNHQSLGRGDGFRMLST